MRSYFNTGRLAEQTVQRPTRQFPLRGIGAAEVGTAGSGPECKDAEILPAGCKSADGGARKRSQLTHEPSPGKESPMARPKINNLQRFRG